jgi:hypothetical protein
MNRQLYVVLVMHRTPRWLSGRAVSRDRTCPGDNARRGQASAAGPAEWFTGRVRVDPLWAADGNIKCVGGLGDLRARRPLAWHTHPTGQRLVVSLEWVSRRNGASPCRSSGPATLSCALLA